MLNYINNGYFLNLTNPAIMINKTETISYIPKKTYDAIKQHIDILVEESFRNGMQARQIKEEVKRFSALMDKNLKDTRPDKNLDRYHFLHIKMLYNEPSLSDKIKFSRECQEKGLKRRRIFYKNIWSTIYVDEYRFKYNEDLIKFNF